MIQHAAAKRIVTGMSIIGTGLLAFIPMEILFSSCTSPSLDINGIYAVDFLSGLSLFGAFAVVYAGLVRYPPVDMLAPAILFVIGFVMVSLFLRQARKEGERPSGRHFAAALLPWTIAVICSANGALDHSEETRHATVVVQTRYGSRIGGRRLIVRSWRPDHETETIYLSAFARFYFPGQQITIGVKSGALGVPWISSVSR